LDKIQFEYGQSFVDILRRDNRELKSTVKELNCLFSILRLLADNRKTKDDVLQAVVHLIPLAWPQPDNTFVRMVFQGQEFVNKTIPHAQLRHKLDIVMENQKAGTLEVGYGPHYQFFGQPVNAQEEKVLLERIAQQVVLVISHKKIDEEIKARGQKYFDIFRESRDGYVMVDMSRKIVATNSVFQDMLGYTEEDLRHKTIRDVTPPKWHELSRQVLEEQALKHGYSDIIEKEYIRKDGQIFPAEVRVYRIGSEKDPQGFWAYVRDISKNKKDQLDLLSEKNFSDSVINSIPGIFYVFDQGGKPIRWNRNLVEVSGYTPQEIAGMHPLDFVDQSDKEIVAKGIMEVFANGFHTLEANLIAKGGTKTRYCLRAHRFDQEGKAYIVGVGFDMTDHFQRGEELRRSEEKFRRLAENIPGVICMYKPDPLYGMVYVNDQVERLTGYRAEEFLSGQVNFSSLQHRDQQQEIFGQINRALSERSPFRLIYRLKHKNGQWRWVEEFGAGVFHQGTGELMFVEGFMSDITSQKVTEESLSKFSSVVDQSPAAVMITDVEGNIEYMNSRFSQMSGYKPKEVIGKKANILKSGTTSEKAYRDMWTMIKSGKDWHGQFQNKRKDGKLFWEEVTISPIRSPEGKIAHFVAMAEDISIRKEYEERILYQANFDSLTDLPNRLLSADRLAQAINRARRNDNQAVVMFVDLDQFKVVNDTLGHEIGDKVILEAAGRLKSCVRSSDTVARISGDQFFIVLPDLKDVLSSEVITQKVLSSFDDPILVGGHEIFTTVSIGVSVYPDDGQDVQELMRNADTAMNRAKAKGRNTVCFYTQELNDKAIERLEMNSQLRHAIENGEFSMHYQPFIDLKTGMTVGAESLLRWDNKKFGSVPPDTFIPLLNEGGLTDVVGEWVLHQACRQAKAWQDKLGAPLFVSVNVSSRQFMGGKLAEQIDKALKASGLPPESLELEITEQLLLEDVPRTMSLLEEIKKKGVRLALDDFGMGYSALSYLKRFPFDTLKIDRSFMSDIGLNKGNGTLVTVIIVMALTLGLKVVVEGVETEEQWKFVASRGCSLGQGFYFSRPLPPNEFEHFSRYV